MRWATLLCALAGCAAQSRSDLPDAARPDALAAADAGSPPDALALPDGADLNPLRIRLVDVSLDAVGAWLPGGDSRIDPWDVGSGVALGDLDGDGRLDLVLARSDDPTSPPEKRGGPSTILWNVSQPGGSPHFTVEALSALAGVSAHGVALGDFDGDGDLDLFIAASGPDFLLRNDGGGHFTDVTGAAGVGGPADDDTTGAVWVDVNADGRLDLYVYQYSQATPPYAAEGARNRLYLNLGSTDFLDISSTSGTDSDGATQAVAAFDPAGDGGLALLVANDRFCSDGVAQVTPLDRLPGDAWLARASIDGEGVPRFSDEAAARGVVACRSSMGVGIGDLDGDLRPDVYVTDIGAKSLYLSGGGAADGVATAAAYGVAARTGAAGDLLTSWGARFLDLDRDGLPELMVVNGSLNRPFLCKDFHQLDVYLRVPAPGAAFADVTGAVGLPTQLGCEFSDFPIAGRGLVTGDLDGDGDDDLVIAPWNEPLRIYRNDTPGGRHFVRVRPRGTVSSPDPIGALLVVTRLDGRRAAAFRYAGGDTYSQSDGVLEVGLGGDTAVRAAELRWPSGVVTRLDGIAVDREVSVDEPRWLAVSGGVLTVVPPGGARMVSATRSDGLPVVFTDGGGSFVAPLPPPASPRRTVVTVSLDGVPQRPRPLIIYK